MSTVKDIKIIEAKLELKDGSNGKMSINLNILNI